MHHSTHHIVVTGSLGYDYIMNFSGKFMDRIMPEHMHKISFAPLVDSLNKQFGGTAGNIAYSLKLLGVEPFIVACAGNDFDLYKRHLKKHHISTAYIVVRQDVTSGTYFVVTDVEDNQIGAYYQGALLHNDQLVLDHIESTDFVVISPNLPNAMISFVNKCKEKHISYMYDPAFQIGDFSKNVLLTGIDAATIVIGNDYEVTLMEKKLVIPHKELVKRAHILITTLGAGGSLIETPEQSFHISPANVTSVSDPTGAGDAYRAGFLAGFVKGLDLQTCGQMGSVAAAYTVELYGTQTHTYTKKQFIKRYKSNYQITAQL